MADVDNHLSMAWVMNLAMSNDQNHTLLFTQTHLYLVHIELAQIITSDRNEVWVWDLYHSTALVEAAKSLALSNVIGYG